MYLAKFYDVYFFHAIFYSFTVLTADKDCHSCTVENYITLCQQVESYCNHCL